MKGKLRYFSIILLLVISVLCSVTLFACDDASDNANGGNVGIENQVDNKNSSNEQTTDNKTDDNKENTNGDKKEEEKDQVDEDIEFDDNSLPVVKLP